jgi:hypothetical protein
MFLAIGLCMYAEAWQPPVVDAGEFPCTIERRQACSGFETSINCLSESEFSLEFENKRPVLISGLTEKWPANSLWSSKSQFLSLYGDVMAKFATAQETTDFNNVAVNKAPLRDILAATAADPDIFVFDHSGTLSSRTSSGHALIDDILPPELSGLSALLPVSDDGRQRNSNNSTILKSSSNLVHPNRWQMLSFSGHKGGLGWHLHGPSWLALVVGLKQWFLFPPGEGAGDVGPPFMSSAEWVRTVYAGLAEKTRPLTCAQVRGDVM